MKIKNAKKQHKKIFQKKYENKKGNEKRVQIAKETFISEEEIESAIELSKLK